MEEVDPEDETADQTPNDLIKTLHRVHCDNSRLQYYARSHERSEEISMMPLSPFIFEYFLFNSLYQVDWKTSVNENLLIFHPEEGLNESGRQKAFLAFLKRYATNNPGELYRAFEPLLHFERAEGGWTQVTPDARVSVTEGENFFKRIVKLQSALAQCRTPSEMPTNKEMFKILKECTLFIYKVRNNIFHGSKTLLEIYEKSQKRRLEVYDLFLKGITSLFFLASGKTEAACDFVPCPIFSSSLPASDLEEIMSQSRFSVRQQIA
jgi:hypothetical protein